MSWINLGNIKANQEWRVTAPFKGNLIKIEQSISTLQISKNASTKLGLIGLLIEDQFFSIQQFFSEPKEQIFYFNYLGFDNCQIAIRDLSKYISKDNWGINCFYWNSLINQQIDSAQEINLSIQALSEIQKINTETIVILGKEFIRLKRRINNLISEISPLIDKNDEYWNINCFGNDLLIGNNLQDIIENNGDEYWNINCFGNDLLIGNV